MVMDWEEWARYRGKIHAALPVGLEIKSYYFNDKIMEFNHIPLGATKKMRWINHSEMQKEKQLLSFYSVMGKHYLTLLMLIIYLN